MTEKTSTIINAFHYKNGEDFPALPGYVHVWSGKAGSTETTVLTGDDSGNNISEKNRYFSELTGIYWVWKNQKSDLVGTCHYRRFFTTHALPLRYKIWKELFFLVGLKKKREGLIYTSNVSYWQDKIMSCDETAALMEQYDAILPQARTLKYSVKEHYRRYHNPEDLVLIKQIIEEKHQEYLPDFETVLSSKRLYANNMFVLKRETFDELATWLFDVLFEFERRVDLNSYQQYQERIFGFLSERLITTWFEHMNLDVKELPLIYFKRFKKR